MMYILFTLNAPEIKPLTQATF